MAAVKSRKKSTPGRGLSTSGFVGFAGGRGDGLAHFRIARGGGGALCIESPMLASPDTSAVRRQEMFPRAAATGLTLIELLVIMAIIAILAGMSLGVMKGVNERAARVQAEAELAALSLALETYKTQYGDYPQAGTTPVAPLGPAGAGSAQGQLFNALMGKLSPTLQTMDGRSYVETSRFSLQTANMPLATGTVSVANGFLDPWGRLYMYYYRSVTGGDWRRRGYVLYSVGPDGVHDAPNAQGGVATSGNNADNLYANGLTPQ